MNDGIVVIGGGPAGVEAAVEAASLGCPVHLISDAPVGGRAGWHSLLPSKVWLDAAERAQRGTPVSTEKIVARVAAVKKSWNDQLLAALDTLNVDVVQGVGSFSGPHSVVAQDAEGAEIASFAGLPVIVATGSVPVFPGPLKPDGRQVLAPRFLSKLEALPPSMIVVGAGATGCESAYLFNALGVEVTWIVDQYGILPQIYAPMGRALGAALKAQGVNLVAGQMVSELVRDDEGVTAVLMDGVRCQAGMAFVAVGRRPDWERLNLDAAGIAPVDGQPLALNSFGQTANPFVYLVGDVDGRAMTANKAAAQARVAARHACGLDVTAFDLNLIPQPVFTEPQVAQVGQMTGPGVAVQRVSYSESLKGHILSESGFLDLAYNVESGQVSGAAAVGPHAADAVASIVPALRLGASLAAIADLYGAYPTLSELPFIAARKALRS